MVRLKLNTGRKNGTRPGQVVGSIAGGSGIPGGSIGKIDIKGGHTMIDIPAQYVDQVLAKSGLYKIGNRRVRVE
jgi:ATP-dependent RNA helicase DeaD